MIDQRAIVISVAKTIVPGQPLLGELTASLSEASKGWDGEQLPTYFLIRLEGYQRPLSWKVGDISHDVPALTAWCETTSGIGRIETASYFDPVQPPRTAQRTRIERKKVVADGSLDRSMKQSEVVPALRPLLTAEGRRECDDIWCFLSAFAQKTPGDVEVMERFLTELPEKMPAVYAADRVLKGILSASMRAIVERRPGVTMVCCSWPLDLRDGRPDFATIQKKAKELIEFKRPAKETATIHRDDDIDVELTAAKYF
ncbi:hypothetical protein LJR098_000828 [Rhizobium sp. LjRoot98]|uniref:hypothetical protein n=1 Tax=Rhizobium sp. LjRoot98 TaxID=3342345 RepID=UPI003ED0B4F7